MKKLKYLLLALLLSLSVVLSGCVSFVVIDEPGREQEVDVKEDVENITDDSDSEQQSDGSKDKSEESNLTDSTLDQSDQKNTVEYGKSYTSKEDVALYLHVYEELPPNYITKKEAQNLGWNSKDGNLGEVAPGKSIGGDTFGNREGILPKGKSYHECDIDSDGGYRNAKRIVYSDDWCIYYTEDHYESFELLYGGE